MAWASVGDMRQARIKVSAEEGEAIYHCITRTVNGERLFDDVAKEVLRKQLWQVADFCGVEILTYAILSNHFHVLVRVPQKSVLADAELLRRYAVLYPKPKPYQAARLEVVKAQLASNGPDARRWRKSLEALMGDVSPFMKLLKQRFSVWFNKSHKRFGTLWSERFKSVLVEPNTRVVATMAAYIDLNGVRAGLATDPKDYRFCGYAEAVAGKEEARKGLMAVTGEKTWKAAQQAYRQGLFGIGAGAREQGATITWEDFQRVMAKKGKLAVSEVLRCRVRYFSDGAVLGSKAFVAEHLERYRRRTGLRERTQPRPLAPVTEWGDLTTLRGLRRSALGD
jgi:putative transposase